MFPRYSKGMHFSIWTKFFPNSFKIIWSSLSILSKNFFDRPIVHDTLCFSKFLADCEGLEQTCHGITSSPFFVRSRWTNGSLFLRVSPKWHQLQRHCWILSRPHICQSKQSPKSRVSFTQDLRKLQNKRYTCSYFLDLPMYYFSIFSPGVELKSRGWGS